MTLIVENITEYKAYYNAKRRCTVVTSDWKYYGGKGIEMQYKNFEEFFADLGPKPGRKYSLDRINNDDHYRVGNCRWATSREQHRNRSIPHTFYTLGDKSLTIPEWAREYGITQQMLGHRIKQGMSLEAALKLPRQPGKKLP